MATYYAAVCLDLSNANRISLSFTYWGENGHTSVPRGKFTSILVFCALLLLS